MINEASITWQTPVQQSLQDLNFKRADYGARINLQHLLSQSSGLIPHAYTNMIEDHASYEQIIKRLDRVDFVCAPGTCYGYQNVAFSLVGDVVEAQVGTDYSSYVTDRIFSPLGMNRASFGQDAFVNDSNHASPHIRSGDNWASTRTTGHYYKVPPAAGVNASIEDMTHWLLAQLGDSPVVLSPQMLDMMQSQVIKTTPRQAHYRRRLGLSNTGYGLGWRVFDYAGDLGNVHHGGYVKGMRSEMVFNRKHQTGLVFLTNSEPGVINDMVFDFLDLHRDFRGDRDRAVSRMAARMEAGAASAEVLPAADPSVQRPPLSMAPIGGS
jgi:beta-lactamase class C